MNKTKTKLADFNNVTHTGPRMDLYFSLFNGHVNRATTRADKEFIAQFGQDKFNEVIKPYHDNGIMAILDSELTPHIGIWLALVVAYVNENAKGDK